MDFPIVKSPQYKGFFLRIDTQEENLSLFNGQGEFVKSVKLEELVSFLMESRKSTKRKNLRTLMAVKIKYQSASGPWKESITGTLGTGGLFIETPAPLDKGSELSVEFTLPDSPLKVIKTKGKVVWTRNQFEKVLYFPGMGIEFSDLSNEERDAISRLIKTINKSRGIE